MTKSALQIARAAYVPKMPVALRGSVRAVEGAATEAAGDKEEIKRLFPHTYGMPAVTFERGDAADPMPPINAGVILSGGQAPGGHNVIAGLFDGLKAANPESRLFGFILGPGGLVEHKYMELTADIIDEYRNTGGFDMIGSGRTKLERREQFDKGLEILKELGISALVIIGGDDSNTNAAVLAEYYRSIGAGVSVIGCPKTIDGDLKNDLIETSFGFDTACKVYSEVIGNIQRDCNSARKYWHFIKLMGRSASHIALECALQTHPNVCIISEEVEANNYYLDDVVTYIASRVDSNIRELEGALTRLIKYASMMRMPIDETTCVAALGNYLRGEKGRRITMEMIERIVCTHFKVTSEDIRSTKRSNDIAYPRQIAMYLCHELTDVSWPTIGGFFNKDHSTIIHAHKKIQKLIESNPATDTLIKSLSTQIRGI